MPPSSIPYIDAHRAEFLEELFALLRIPSVSSDPAARPDMDRAAAFLRDRLAEAGLRSDVLPTAGLPVVYAERLRPGRPTVLVYGHYDVQPPEPLEKWRHGPFDPTVEDGNIVARGASDDKGQVYALLAGCEAAIASGGAEDVGVKFLLEGEEEIGSPSLAPFIRKERERLRADCVVIADTGQFSRGLPAITYGLRGLAYLEVIVRGPSKDLHSGSYGGAVMNPAIALARMVAACHGPFGRVAIPGFYDRVRPIEEWEREEFARLPFREDEFLAEVGAPAAFGEEGYTTLERKWARPTFDVNGMVSGFTGEGSKTVLPAEARAKMSMRLVPDQDPAEIARLAIAYLEEIAPPGVRVEVMTHHSAAPVLVRRDGPGVLAAETALREAFGVRPVFIREGGSIPVVVTFREEIGAPSVLMGLGLPDDNAHSPNEKFSVEDFRRGMVAMAAFLREFGARSGA
jgi:acetylornithine deacetylase/succinyl-diaminopimelate desuccinylase-like protein